jgi:LuxR family transcriptional regulator, maltose regulon positive regulatory protein
MGLHEAIAALDYERLSALHQEMQELDQDEEVIWHMLPLFCSFILHYRVWGEGARLVPRLLSGPLPDQAALFAVLLKINRLGLTLLSLKARNGAAPHETGNDL